MVSRYEVHPMEQNFRDWNDKRHEQERELNAFIQRRWDELAAEGKHGHYETLFAVCRDAIKFRREQFEQNENYESSNAAVKPRGPQE